MPSSILPLLRKQRGLTQVKVAELMGVSQSAVSKIESGRDVSLAQLRDYIAALGGLLEVAARFDGVSQPLDVDAVRYGQRASARRVRERSVSGNWGASSPFADTSGGVGLLPENAEWETVVAPEWLEEVNRIRAMTPRDRLQELANGAAFFAVARRID